MKSYINITKTCQLFGYQELAMWRVESWIDENGIWDCYWFWSNDSALPNTYKLRDF
jgi:hypothetical protein